MILQLGFRGVQRERAESHRLKDWRSELGTVLKSESKKVLNLCFWDNGFVAPARGSLPPSSSK